MKQIKKLGLLFLMIFVIAGCAPGIEKGTDTTDGKENIKDTPSEMLKVTLYYPTVDALYLVPVEVEVIKEDQWLEKAVASLSNQPKSEELSPALPSEKTVNSISIKDHVGYVDLNSEALKSAPKGATYEQLLSQSIVYTLAKNANVTEVIFTVDGKETETLLGHIDLLDPIRPEEDILKK